MNLYFISGLGADKRIFRKLILPESYTIHHMDWAPVTKTESIESYCEKLSLQIDQSLPFILVGLSFGGLIAIELSRKLKPVQTIIISSFCFKKEVPAYYILMGKLRIHRLITSKFLLRPAGLMFRIMGAKNADEKNLLSNILKETDPHFLKWAINQLFSWDNTWQPENFLHIHGTADKLLPMKANMNAIAVEGGEHLMVYSQAEWVSRILINNLKSAPLNLPNKI